jgi:tripartite-type tricarboxylate transporter receptor subunit TctC
MKKIFLSILLLANISFAAEHITIFSPYSPSHSGTPAIFKIIEEANKSQQDYIFNLEFKPGGQQLVAVKEMDKNPNTSLSIIAPKFVEHTMTGKLDENSYIPVHALGDACWAVISNLGTTGKGVASLEGIDKLVVGGVGVGNASHLPGLQIGDKLGATVRYIVFKSNFEALMLMVNDGSINLVVDRMQHYQNFKNKGIPLNILAVSCPTRVRMMPDIPTLKEQGIDAPFVFNITVASKSMPKDKRDRISGVLNMSTKNVGAEEIHRLSDMNPPIFLNISAETYFKNSTEIVKTLLEKHKEKIAAK